ncbi:hypothetical protein [Streptomyces sp. NPDC046870]|uniref:DsbA family protein n=1 Tax=Streptomyces sp. NPDC046870 TaxID=3155135 RepID=UPI0034556EC7
MDVHTLREDLRRRIHSDRIERDIASADRSRVSGTPAFFFNGQRHNSAPDLGALTQAPGAAREGAERACLRPEPKEQLRVLRLAVRRHRTRAQRGPTRPGRAGRRTTTRASTRPAPTRLRPVARRVHGAKPTPSDAVRGGQAGVDRLGGRLRRLRTFPRRRLEPATPPGRGDTPTTTAT